MSLGWVQKGFRFIDEEHAMRATVCRQESSDEASYTIAFLFQVGKSKVQVSS